MSSPQITRMFGFFASWARAGSADTTARPRPASARARSESTVEAINHSSLRGRRSPARWSPGAPREAPGPLHHAGRVTLVRRVRAAALELVHHLREVVARGRLHRRERLEGLEPLEPELLADRQQVPVVEEGGARAA